MADLYREYGVDLRQLFVPGTGIDPFLVLALTHQLPYHSAFMTAYQGNPEARGWDVTSYLVTHAINEVRTSNYIMQALKADPKHLKKIEKPKPFPLPGAAEQERSEVNHFTSTAASILAEVRNKKGG